MVVKMKEFFEIVLGILASLGIWQWFTTKTEMGAALKDFVLALVQ